jgi:uncharacterized membrane protein
MAKSEKTMFLYVGAYEDESSAENDYDVFLELHKEGWVGSYDIGIVTKDENGKIDIKRHTDSTGKGAKRGLAVGALIGVIFPPSILVSGAVGAGAGAALGHRFNDISKEDMKEIGSYIEDNEAAMVVIGDLQVQEMVDKAAKSALKEYKKEFDASAKSYDKELDKAIKEI